MFLLFWNLFQSIVLWQLSGMWHVCFQGVSSKMNKDTLKMTQPEALLPFPKAKWYIMWKYTVHAKQFLIIGVVFGSSPYWGFLKWWYPTTTGFSYYKWSFWGVLRVPPFKETTWNIHISSTAVCLFWGVKNTEEYNAFLRHESLRIAVLGIFECSKERVASEEAKVEQEDGPWSNWGMSGMSLGFGNLRLICQVPGIMN